MTIGAYDDARSVYERSLALLEGVFGPDHPDIAISLAGLAQTLARGGDNAGAIALLERAYAIEERSYDSGHANLESLRMQIESLCREHVDVDQ